MSNFNKVRLDIVADIIDCKHVTPKYVEEGIPVVSPGVLNWGQLNTKSSNRYVTKEDYIHLMDHCSVETGDLVFSRNQSLGITSFIGKKEPFVLGQDTVLIQSKRCNSVFLFYIFQSEYLQRKIDRLAGGSTFKRINLKDLRSLKILLPPLAEQEKIAEILSTWDHAIEQTERLKTNAETHKQALMQQLLTGKKRFPEFEGEWEKIRLGDYAKIQSGGTPRTTIAEYYDNGKIPWVSISDMTAYGKYINKTDRNITDKGLENSSAKLYPQGTVLYAMYASIGEVSIASVDLTSSQAILGIQPDPEVINNHYLYFYLKSLQEKIILMGQQGTQSNLNAGMVKGFRLNLPSLEEQQKIAAVLNTADREIELLAQKLDHLKTEKRALMQQLLTGKRRVKVDG